MKPVLVSLAIAGIMILVSGAPVASPPASESAVPIFPGVTRDKAAEAERLNNPQDELSNPMSPEAGFTLQERSARLYTTGAPLEEVFRFYRDQLGAQENPGDETDPRELAPGESTPVRYSIRDYDYEFTDDYYAESDSLLRSGKFVRQSLEAHRKPYKTGGWMSSASFEWAAKEPSGEIAFLAVRLEDRSFSPDWKSYQTRTAIATLHESYMFGAESEEASEAEAWEEEPEPFGAPAGAPAKGVAMKPPTEAALGAPIYPGSVFDARSSAGIAASGYAYYIFLTGDPPAKVAAYYEQKLKVKAAEADGMYMIPLKGELPVPDEGIAIQPNMLAGSSAKTMITFQKQTE